MTIYPATSGTPHAVPPAARPLHHSLNAHGPPLPDAGRSRYPSTFAVCPNRIFFASSVIGLLSLIAAPLA